MVSEIHLLVALPGRLAGATTDVDNEDSKTVIGKAPHVKNTICNALVLVGLKMLKPPRGKAIGWISTSKKIKVPFLPIRNLMGRKGTGEGVITGYLPFLF